MNYYKIIHFNKKYLYKKYFWTTEISISFTDFLNWKSQIEDETIQYFKRASSVTVKNDQKLTKTYYFCKHSSTNKVKKTNKTCPSRFTLVHIKKDDKYEVTYYSTHLGHDGIANKLKKSERQILADRIKNGNNLNDILEDVRNEKKCNSELNDLNMLDLHNIIRDFNIDKNIVNYGQSRTEKAGNEDRTLANVKEDKANVERSDTNIDIANTRKIYILEFNKTVESVEEVWMCCIVWWNFLQT